MESATKFIPLPSYGCGSVQRTTDGFRVEALPAVLPDTCPHCGARDLTGFGRRTRPVIDLPLQGRPLRLDVQARRFRCDHCQRTFFPPLPEIDNRRYMTLRAKRWIGEAAKERSNHAIAKEVGVSEGTIRLVLKDLISRDDA